MDYEIHLREMIQQKVDRRGCGIKTAEGTEKVEKTQCPSGSQRFSGLKSRDERSIIDSLKRDSNGWFVECADSVCSTLEKSPESPCKNPQ